MSTLKSKAALKRRLRDLRQDPQYHELKSDIRQALRYIDALEADNRLLRRQLSNKRSA